MRKLTVLCLLLTLLLTGCGCRPDNLMAWDSSPESRMAAEAEA